MEQKKHFARLANTSFSNEDVAVRLTYADRRSVADVKAQHDLRNFLIRLENHRKRMKKSNRAFNN